MKKTDDKNRSKTWGLALCGGAACGLANIGVLQALHESGLRPDCLSGSSMGAVVAALSALGHSPSVILEAAESLRPLDIAALSTAPLRAGLHGGLLRQQLSHLDPLVGDARIGDCEIPFVCVAGRVRSPIRWERLLFPDFVTHLRDSIAMHVFAPDVRIIDALQASSAVPVIFSPAEIGGEQYVDLVHFGAVPARSLREAYEPDVVVATDTRPRFDQFEPWLPGPLRDFLDAGWQESVRDLEAADLAISPKLPDSMFRFDLAGEFASAGRVAATARLAEIRSLIA